MELLRNHDSEGPHLLMSSSLIDAVRTHLPADLDMPTCLDTEQQWDLVHARPAPTVSVTYTATLSVREETVL